MNKGGDRTLVSETPFISLIPNAVNSLDDTNQWL